MTEEFFLVTRWKIAVAKKVSLKYFLHSEKQENIPTPEWLQESDSMCKGIKMLCSLQIS